MENTENTDKNQNAKPVNWILYVCLVGILGISIHKFIKTGEVPYTQFGIVSALSVSLIRSIPALAKRIYLQIIMIVLAVVCLGLAVYRAM